MAGLRSRLVSWLGRKYFAKVQKKGLNLADMSLIPDHALMPLRRNELDPVPALGQTRDREPISRVDLPFGINMWLVSGYHEAKVVLGKVEEFSNDFGHLVGNAGVTAEENPGGLGFVDPPVHTRLRRMLTPEFTKRRLARLEPRIEAIVDGQLDEIARAGAPVDLMQAFALPIPSLTICELLGVPYEDRAEFQRLSTARFDLFEGANASLGAISESLTYLREVVARERAQPGDGLLGMLVREHGDNIDDTELAGLADGLLTGGLETTASMLALGTVVLLRDEDGMRQLRDDEDSVHRFVEELLRYLTVVQVAFPRFAKEDMEIAGKRVAKGDIVIVSLSGADRDAVLGEGMERFAPDREPTSHLAFGYGIHRCIGAELARMELRTAYPALARRFPDMRLAIDPAELSFRQTSIVYGVESLPVLPGVPAATRR